MKKLLLIALLVLMPIVSFAATPVLLFSDMVDAPYDGWEGSSIKGAAVTVWGFNFGSAAHTSYITCGGQKLYADESGVAEWAATTSPTVARSLQRITFYLNSSMTTGAQTISVTTSDGTSGTVALYIRSTGNIYFVDDTGSDTADGTTVAKAWKSIYKARNTLSAGDVVYLKAGTYTETDVSGAIVKFSNNHNNGTENNCIAYCAYPTEAPMMGNSSSFSSGILVQGTDEELFYHTFSKISIAIGSSGNGNALSWGASYPTMQVKYFRFIGCDCTTLQDSKTIISTNGNGASHHYYFLGNYLHDAGKDTRESATGAYKGYAFYLGGYGTSEYYYIGYNEMCWNVNNQGKGIQIYGHLGNDYTPPDEIDNVYIYGNFIHDNNGEGMVLGGGDDGGGAGTEYRYIENVYVYNNIISNNGGTGISIGGPSLHTMGDGGNFYVYNNTLYKNSDTLDISPYTTLGVFSNNLVYNDSSYLSRIGSNTYMSGDKNLFYGSATDYPDWDTNPIITDPKLDNPINDDFHCASDGAGIDAGATITITTPDYDKVSRPQGSAYDIGAYEYVSGSESPGSPLSGNSQFHIGGNSTITFK